jgi:hypothetical protein
VTIIPGLPTTPKVAGPGNTSAFVGTNPTGELITSELPVIGSEPQQFPASGFQRRFTEAIA